VWIYGGGYMVGSAALDLYDPEQYVEHDLVFVAMQYRLGSHGFLYFGQGSEAPGNVGLLDQVGNTATQLNRVSQKS
jgi:carboxylesterase type B